MRRLAARTAGVVAAALVGLVGGAALTLAVQARPGSNGSTPRTPIRAASGASPTPERIPEPPDTILAWTPTRMPDGFEAGVAALDVVRHVVVVRSGTAWLTRSTSASGAAVDRPPAPYAIPLEMAAVSPAAYRPFIPPADQPLLAALGRGEVLLGQASARLRGLGAGATLRFGAVTARVAGVLPDTLMGAHELLASLAFAARIGVERPRFALIEPVPGTPEPRLAAAIRTVVPVGTPLQLRAPGETPYFRQGDAVLPPVAFKAVFGEFAARPRGDGWMDIDPAWQRRYLLTATVPILGTVTCARALFPMLRGALGELRRAGLGHLIDPGDYGGCYAPRFLSRDPGAGISHHAWGAAIDLNVSANPFGRVSSQDPRIVAIFERWGFTWGGRWIVPDGMHFEFIRSATPAA